MIGLKYAEFHLKCISNEKRLFSEIVPPKKHALLVSFTATLPAITTATHTGENSLLHIEIYGRVIPQSCSHNFVCSYRKICDVGMKRRAMKAKEDRFFAHPQNIKKFFLRIMIVSVMPFRSG